MPYAPLTPPPPHPPASNQALSLVWFWFGLYFWGNTVWLHVSLFYIERGFYSRTEIGERGIKTKTAYIMNAAGNKACSTVGLAPLPL
jgi:hypothetical protein